MKDVTNQLPDNIVLLRIGEEQHPLFVIDEFFADPHELLKQASDDIPFQTDETDYYPGIRKPVCQRYQEHICQFIAENIISSTPEYQSADITCTLSAFSIANLPPKRLLPIQRIPHFDAEDPHQWAVVHYLCDEVSGGTGFFRHRQTGYESMTKDRSKHYLRVLEDEAITKGLPPQEYLLGSTKLFKMTHSVDAKFNRAIIYPGNVFHSGLIKNWQAEAIKDARLTANSFVKLRAV